jgi:uncharacterized protein
VICLGHNAEVGVKPRATDSKMPHSFHLFSRRNIDVLIDVVNMRTSQIGSSEDARLLQAITVGDKPVGVRDKACLARYGLVAGTDADITQLDREIRWSTPVTNITLNVIQECNLACVYCYGAAGSYGHHGRMSSATARQAVDWLIRESRDSTKLVVGIFGGEPLLNFGLVREVVKYAQTAAKAAGKHVEFTLTTNGTLLTEEVIDFLVTEAVKVMVSIDGSKVIQDAQRPYRGGGGSYDVVAPKVQRLLRRIPNASCRPTVLAGTDPRAVDNAMQQLGFSSVHLNFASPSLHEGGCKHQNSCRELGGMHSMLDEQTDALLGHVKDRYQAGIEGVNVSRHLFSIVGQFLNRRKRFYPCGAGRGYVAISCTGEIFLCHRFVGQEGQKLGNVYSGICERAQFERSPLATCGKCNTCFARFFCAGGCYHDNLGMTGSLLDPSEDRCQLIRKFVESGAYLVSLFDNEDRKFLLDHKHISLDPCTLDLF